MLAERVRRPAEQEIVTAETMRGVPGAKGHWGAQPGISTPDRPIEERADMNEVETYDTCVLAIRAYNHSLLDGFRAWLEHKGQTAPTIITHLDSIFLFATYLVYDEPLKKLDEAIQSDVYWFLADWFPRKALWASVRSVQAHCASLKKFFL